MFDLVDPLRMIDHTCKVTKYKFSKGNSSMGILNKNEISVKGFKTDFSFKEDYLMPLIVFYFSNSVNDFISST